MEDGPLSTPARLMRGMSLDDGVPGIALFASPISTNKSLANRNVRGIASNATSENGSNAKNAAGNMPRRLSITKFGLHEPAAKFSVPAKMSFGDLASNNVASDNRKFSIPDSRDRLGTGDSDFSVPASMSFEDMMSNRDSPENRESAEQTSRPPGALSFGAMGLSADELPGTEEGSRPPAALSFGAMEEGSGPPATLSFGAMEEGSGPPGALSFGAMEDGSGPPGALSFGDMGLPGSLDFDEPLTERANFEEDFPHDDRSSVCSANSAATEESNVRGHPLTMNMADFPSDTSNDDMPTDRQPQFAFHIRRTSSMGFHHRSPKHHKIPNATNRIQDIERYYDIVRELGK